MAETDVLLLGVAVLVGLGAGVGITFLVLRRRGSRGSEPVEAFEVVADEDPAPPVRVEAEPADGFTFAPTKAPVAASSPPSFDDDAPDFGYERASDELERPPVPQMEDSVVPTEWARRQVGPVDPGRVKGVCSGCGTALSISRRRPLRIACPVCGRTRLLS